MKRLVVWRISQPIVVAFLILVVIVMSSMLLTLVHKNLSTHELAVETYVVKQDIESQEAKLNHIKKLNRVIDAFQFITRNRMDSTALTKTVNQLYRISNSMGFDPLLILAIVSVESRGNPQAVGRYRSGDESGAVGLMQIKESTAKWLAKKLGHQKFKGGQLIRADQNILYGTLYLMELVQKYESLTLGVMAYNVGPNALRRYLKYSPQKLPKKYLNKTLTNYYDLVDQFGPYS